MPGILPLAHHADLCMQEAMSALASLVVNESPRQGATVAGLVFQSAYQAREKLLLILRAVPTSHRPKLVPRSACLSLPAQASTLSMVATVPCTMGPLRFSLMVMLDQDLTISNLALNAPPQFTSGILAR